MTKTIAVLGMGAMGSRMARRWLAAGHRVAVYNRTLARAEALVDEGALHAETPRAAAAGADLVVSVVRDDAASREVWCHPDTGAFVGMKGAAVAVESSTLTVAGVQEVAAAARERGVRFLDAPVVGTRPQADTGTLVHLVGGEAAVLDRVRPLLAVVASATHRVGHVGMGTVMKLAVNALFGIQVAALAEMLGFVARQGVTEEAALELLRGLPITSPAMAGVGGLMVARKLSPMFPIELVEKDFGNVVTTAAAAGVEVPTARAVREVYRAATEAGHGGLNIAGIIEMFADRPAA